MYDTIELSLLQDDCPGINFIDDLPQYLTSFQSNGNSMYGPFVTGHIDNFKISINHRRLKLIGGSLAKYVNGDNQQGMTLSMTREALQKLADQLHLNIHQAKVIRVDIGHNLITKYTPATYLPYFGESIGYSRQEAGSGLYYANTLRQLAFYDKIKEQKKKRLEIVKPFVARHLLRYELRLLTNLERQVKREDIHASLLTNEGFYIQLGKLWRDQYLRVRKLSAKSSQIPATGSVKDLQRYLATLAIRDIGETAIMGMVSEWQQQGITTKKMASDQRKLIRECLKLEMKKLGNPLVEELDKKIKQATRFFI